MKQKKLEEVMIDDILMAVKDGCFYPVDSFLSDSDDSNHTQDYFYFKFLGSVSKRVMKKMFATTNNLFNVYEKNEVARNCY